MKRKAGARERVRGRVMAITILGLLGISFLYVILADLSVSKLHVRRERLIITTVDRGAFQEFIIATGEVKRVAVEKGFVLAGAGRPQFTALLDSHDGARIKIGQRGEFELAGARWDLEVYEVHPEGVNGRVRVGLRSLGEPPPELAARQTIEIRLPLGPSSEETRLARGAFFQTTGGQWVYVVDEADGKAVRRPVRLGRQSPDFFEVLSGLEPGTRVITSSYETFGDAECLILD